MEYVIGDVHGHYEMLMRLLAKLPEDAEPVFVGDLIDRGPQSAGVVALIRERGYRCVMGNHEWAMVEHGGEVIRSIESGDAYVALDEVWKMNGAVETLASYGLVDGEDEYGSLTAADAQKRLERFRDDMAWMASLPLYIELDCADAMARPCVVSHSSVAEVWELRNASDLDLQTRFKETALWSRHLPEGQVPIFNIFGHTPVPHGIQKSEHYVDVDTGAYMWDDPRFGRLSAYCVASGAVESVEYHGCDERYQGARKQC